MAELRIGLVGAGAVGNLLAATLAQNRQRFHWTERNPARRRSLTSLNCRFGDTECSFGDEYWELVDDVDVLPAELDWVVVAVKAPQVAEVVDALVDRDCQVLVVANGLHQHPVHLGLLYGGARIDGGALRATASSKLVIGPLAGVEDRAPELIRCLTAPWLVAGAKEEIETRMWHKLALNCVVNPLTALLDCPNGELASAGDSRLMRGLLGEVASVAGAELGKRWGYTADHLAKDLGRLIGETAANSSSMREDLRAGRETEIGFLNLAVAEAGRCRGIPCPLNQRIGDMICLVTNKRTL